MERTPADERMGLMKTVSAAIETNHGPIGLLLPFLLNDPASNIVSTAALDYALLAPLDDGDPLTGPRLLRSLVDTAAQEPERRAAMLSGLLILGDRRVLPLLQGCWETLDGDRDAALTLVNARTHWTSACQVEFLLNWLDALVISGDEDTFGSVASGLVNIARRGDGIQDIGRVFPVWSTQGDHSHILTVSSIEEFSKLIEPRLRYIEARESEPKIMPYVIAAWGLDP